MITRMVHASFTVSDMERSLKFYRDLLGMKVGFDTNQVGIRMGGPMCEKLTACPDKDARTVFLHIDGGVLELVEYRPLGKPLINRMNCDTGSAHVCYKTDDIQALYQRLVDNGVKVTCEPQNLEGETWLMFFQDPDGIYLEVAQGQLPVEL